MLTRGRGGTDDRGLFRVTVAGIAGGLALALVTTGCGAGALPPHPASAQHPASTQAASVLAASVRLAMLSDMCLEATGLDDTDMKVQGPRRVAAGYRGPAFAGDAAGVVGPTAHEVTLLSPCRKTRKPAHHAWTSPGLAAPDAEGESFMFS